MLPTISATTSNIASYRDGLSFQGTPTCANRPPMLSVMSRASTSSTLSETHWTWLFPVVFSDRATLPVPGAIIRACTIFRPGRVASRSTRTI